MNKEKKHILYFDLLNIIACLCVIYMHCNSAVHAYSNTRVWKESLLVETVAYWAVPIFFMLSGATLMEDREKYDTKTYFKKRIVKTFVPFILWNFFILIEKGLVEKTIELGNLKFTTLVDMIVNSKIEGIYWFFIPLFMVYLSIPVLAQLKENLKVLIYMTGIGIVTYSVLPFIMSIMNIPFNSNLNFPLTGGYIVFVIVGYILSKKELPKRSRYIIYFGGILGIVIRYGMTYTLSIRDGQLNKISWGYLNLPSVLLAVAVFTLFKYIKWDKIFKTEKIKDIIRKISGASFGVYLIHMLVIRVLLHYFSWNTFGWKWRYGGALIVYACALIIVLLMKKIPLIKRIVP